jgi:hypothetical protein
VKLTEYILNALPVAEQEDSFATTQRLRAWCRWNEWPEDIVSQIYWVQQNGEGTVFYPPHISDRVLFLEYGDQDTPPSAVLRNFMTNLKDDNALILGFSRGLKRLGVK